MVWIHEALDATGIATIRRRRLPAEIVVWIVICLSIFRSRSISGVVEALDLALPEDKGRFAAKSAIAQARQRLGGDPLRELFRRSATEWTANQSPEQVWCGLTLWVMDGTTLKTPDTKKLLKEFGAQNYASGKRSSYPQIRGVTLTSLPSRILADASFGMYDVSEMRYAEELIPRIPDHSLTIFDKGFTSAVILLGLSRCGVSRHYLIPARINRQSRFLSGTDDDALIEMNVTKPARIRSPDLPDKDKYPAEGIRLLYSQRWEVETSYLEVKMRMFLNSLTLRSLTTEGIRQEIWAAFIGYNLVRLSMVESAALRGVSPRRLSFKKALELLQDELVVEAVAPGMTEVPAGVIQRRRMHLAMDVLPERKGRKFDRAVKSRPTRYAVRWSRTDPEDRKKSRDSKATRKKRKQR